MWKNIPSVLASLSMLSRANEGYKCVPCASTRHDLDCNTSELVTYFKEGTSDESVVGFMTAPWCQTLWKNKEIFDKSLRLLKEDEEKFYKIVQTSFAIKIRHGAYLATCFNYMRSLV